jgi:hypothetical protein
MGNRSRSGPPVETIFPLPEPHLSYPYLTVQFGWEGTESCHLYQRYHGPHNPARLSRGLYWSQILGQNRLGELYVHDRLKRNGEVEYSEVAVGSRYNVEEADRGNYAIILLD